MNLFSTGPAAPAKKSLLQEFCERYGHDYEKEKAGVERRAKEDEAKLRALVNGFGPLPPKMPRTPADPSPAKAAATPIEVIISHPLFEGIKTKAQLRAMLAKLLLPDINEIVQGAIEGSKANGTESEGASKEAGREEEEWQPEEPCTAQPGKADRRRR